MLWPVTSAIGLPRECTPEKPNCGRHNPVRAWLILATILYAPRRYSILPRLHSIQINPKVGTKPGALA